MQKFREISTAAAKNDKLNCVLQISLVHQSSIMVNDVLYCAITNVYFSDYQNLRNLQQ